MLRPPTTITRTSEDIAAYDDTRNNRLENIQPNNTTAGGSTTTTTTTTTATAATTKGGDGKVDPNDEVKPLPGGPAADQGWGRDRVGVWVGEGGEGCGAVMWGDTAGSGIYSGGLEEWGEIFGGDYM